MTTRKSQKKQKQQSGGAGGADHAISVYGNMNDQHAVSVKDNQIAINDSQTKTPVTMAGGKKSKKQTGGNGAADYAKSVYGDMNDQRAESDVSNKIAMKGGDVVELSTTDSISQPDVISRENMSTTNTWTDFFKSTNGGRISKEQLQKTIKKQLKQLKQKGGSSQTFSKYSSDSGQPHSQVSEGLPNKTAVVEVHTNQQTDNSNKGGEGNISMDKLDLAKGFNKVGGKLSKNQLNELSQQLGKLQHQQQGGVGVNEIIVPLLLLYASHKYSNSKTSKQKVKSMRKSMRRSPYVEK
jgi:hypothetical protein